METVLTQAEKDYLWEIYFNPQKPEAFTSPRKLYRYVKKDGKFNITLKSIQVWLSAQEEYTTNRQVTRRIKRRGVIAPYKDYMWDMDTANFRDLSKFNEGYGYFVLVIDVFSRYVWTRAIKTTSGLEVTKAISDILQGERKPLKLRTDRGVEFVNQKVKALLSHHKIDHFVTQNEVKANYAERAIQTIKSRLSRYMRSKQTFNWKSQLENITLGYNNSYHRTIRKAPVEISKEDEKLMWEKHLQLHPTVLKKDVHFKFSIGDVVRISRLRHAFHRYYSEHWTNEYFTIRGRSMKQNIPAYTLSDYGGEEIIGIFYEPELQKILVDEDTIYKIEKVLRKRKRNNIKEALVKWWGWPEKFNSWIPEVELKNFK